MFAVIQIPEFSLRALLRFKPMLRREPVGVLAGEGRRAVVLHVSPSAPVVSPGMTAAQALAECPALQLVSPSLSAEREAGALLLAAAWTLSPRVEPTSSGTCTVDLSGVSMDGLPKQLQALRERLGAEDLEVRIGIGPNPLLARYAVQTADPECWVAEPRAFLDQLPISLLALTPEEERLFRDLGLRTLGSITAFPRAALANRLGARGDELWARAAGEWNCPLQPAPFPVRFQAQMELEEPVETLEPLLFTVRRFCERLAVEVGQFGSGTARLALVLTLDDEKTYSRQFDLPEPTASANVLFAVLENHLSALQTDAAIVALSLEVFPARRLEQQEGLFDTGLKDAPMFYGTLGRLAAVVGTENVGTPRHGDTHRPDAVVLEPPAPAVPARVLSAKPEAHGPLLRRFRPPLPATVELTDARPSFLISTLSEGEVTVVRRPFWSNGEWWAPEPWAHEEWDVQIGTGLYRLRHVPEGWFVDGIYD
jgi:protein ImuB